MLLLLSLRMSLWLLCLLLLLTKEGGVQKRTPWNLSPRLRRHAVWRIWELLLSTLLLRLLSKLLEPKPLPLRRKLLLLSLSGVKPKPCPHLPRILRCVCGSRRVARCLLLCTAATTATLTTSSAIATSTAPIPSR